MKDRDKIMISMVKRVSRFEYNRFSRMYEDEVKRELRMRMADFIGQEYIEQRMTDDFVEHRLDLYVATPDLFWKIIKEEANRIATRFM